MRILRVVPLLAGIGLVAAAATGAGARVQTARAPSLPEGGTWTVLEAGGEAWGALPRNFEGRILWDLRPQASPARTVRWTVLAPEEAGLAAVAGRLDADRALCATDERDGQPLGCRLFRAADTGPAGPRVLWSELPGEPAGLRAGGNAPGPGERLAAGDSYVEVLREGAGAGTTIRARVVAEGVLLVPAGPQEVILLREEIEGPAALRLRYRFLKESGATAGVLEGPLPAPGFPFRPDRGEVLASADAAVDDGIAIRYQELSDALVAGTTGFLQYSSVKGFCSVTGAQRCNLDSDCPGGETCTGTLTLADIHPGWTSVSAMIGIDRSGDNYQPDPGDPGSSQTIGEIWDFTGLVKGNLTYRTFNTTRDDLAGAACPETCAVRDLGASPPDGSWQSYLKIDTYEPSGARFSRDIFTLNDNDTGANPAIDLPYVSQDELNRDDWTQICPDDSGGGANRLIHFFQFFGADPASADLGRDDSWSSGAWTECDATRGLHLTLASQCDPVCYPTCNGQVPYARGLLGGGAGLASRIIEDGWVLVPSGNYVPALLMRQITDLEAGVDFGFLCFLGNQRNYTIDYFWVHRRYGLLAAVSAPTDESGTMPPDDWSLFGNITDGTDFTWGPFPPHETEALACLSGTQVRWALPADGTNLSGEPGVSDYGYVVSWGSQTDPEELADWDANPQHSPLPGEAGYLAAPAGSEPTSYTIGSWVDPVIHVTVTTALQYTDPDVADTASYRSAAFYKVIEDPARLDAATFRVGQEVAPFVGKSGDDLDLEWPAVDGAESYVVRVWDLATKAEIPCPAGMDCAPAVPMTVHPGGAADGNAYGYRAFAVDPCGEQSAD